MPKHAISAGAALVLLTGPALADLSAQDVWADWQEVAASFGGKLTAASEAYSGGVLTLDGIAITVEMEGGNTQASYGSVTLTERGDGTIGFAIPAEQTFTSTATIAGETSTQTINAQTEGFEGVIREDGATRIYDISAGTVTYSVTDVSGGEADAPVVMEMVLSDLDTTYTSTPDGETLAIGQTLGASGVTMDLSSTGADAFQMTYALTDLASLAEGTVDLAAPAGPVTLATMGLLFSGDMTHKGSTLGITATSEDGPVVINGTSGGGRIAFDISEDTLGYTLSSMDAEMALQLAAFPLPINLSMSEVTTGFALPLGVSDEPKPYALTVAYRDIAIDDALWGLFDPTGQLPRDPATILVDLSGTALMTKDIFGDPAALEDGGAPGELKTMDLTQLRIALAGAELLGSGAVSFPNPGPVPMPVGNVTLSLNGGLGLLDKLVALGFVPAEQAAFVKGMAGVVAKPVGEDMLESEIVFTEGGGITANGLPLQ